eukprot:11166220-Lingulodinium_polyedra.AAC.1
MRLHHARTAKWCTHGMCMRVELRGANAAQRAFDCIAVQVSKKLRSGAVECAMRRFSAAQVDARTYTMRAPFHGVRT